MLWGSISDSHTAQKSFASLRCGGVVGVLLACIPYIWGYLNGYEFERSIEWALGITQTTAESENQKTEGPRPEDAQKSNWREEGALSFAQDLLKDESKYLSYNFVSNRDTARLLMLADGALALYAMLGLVLSKKRVRYLGYLFWAVLWEVWCNPCMCVLSEHSCFN